MTTRTETVPVREAHRFDEAALAAWLAEHVEGVDGAVAVQQFSGGQSNPTFLIAVGDRRLVVRKKPPGKLLRGAHQVEREYRVIRALGETAVPVPRALALCEDEAVIGTPFYVMEHVAGRIFRRPDLPGLSAPDRGAVMASMAETLAALHQVDPDAVGLGDYGRRDSYFERQIRTWSKQYRASETGAIEAMERLMTWLPEHIPAGDEVTIVHGDFRLENLMFHATEPRVVAVLDWELSTLGHPLADLAYSCLGYHLREPSLGGLAGLDLAALGMPDEAGFVASYRQRTGRAAIDGWPFYLAFAVFRVAAIVQGVYARSLQGNASSATAGQYGEIAKGMAALGWHLAGKLK